LTRDMGLTGSREDSQVVDLQDSDPAHEVVGVILPGFCRLSPALTHRKAEPISATSSSAA
jgi:hypothetical protein